MITWEIDVDIRVRKTLTLTGLTSEEAVRRCIESVFVPGGLSLTTFQKWESDGESYPRPRPVEQIIDNDPQIVAIRRV